MGAYSQRRKRGGGGLPAATGPSIPPPVEADWEVGLGDPEPIAFAHVLDAHGNTHYELRWKHAESSEWTIWSFPPQATGDDLPFAPDSGDIDVQIRWSNETGTITSPPSDTKTLVVPP